MKLHDLRPPGRFQPPRRRVGRGIGGKGGKTAGRGTKGQGARDTIPAGFEGGQLPLTQRIPKLRGSTTRSGSSTVGQPRHPRRRSTGDVVTPTTLVAAGLVHARGLVKVLGRGELHRAVAGRGPRLLALGPRRPSRPPAARVELLPPPFGDGRPPARGNALTNR